jgi:hypothetical protein
MVEYSPHPSFGKVSYRRSTGGFETEPYLKIRVSGEEPHKPVHFSEVYEDN